MRVPDLSKSSKLASFLLLLGLLAVTAAPVHGQRRPPTPEQIKFLMLRQFALHFKWPADRQAEPKKPRNFVLGILGKNPFAAEIRQFDGRPIGKRGWTLEVRKLKDIGDGRALRACHAVYVAADLAGQLARLKTILAKHPALIIGDTKGLGAQGAMLNFVKLKRTVGFELNLSSLRAAGFEVPSTLSVLAHRIFGRSSQLKEGGG